MKMFSVFDDAAGVFCTPFFSVSENAAKRDFCAACRDSQSMISKFPKDYSLFLVGEFDQDSGVVVGCEPLKIMSASSLNIEEEL